jgi:DNA-directed RNA polymerase subunit E'/Rpb7
MDSIFMRVPLREKIVVHPSALNKDVDRVIADRLVQKFEGICSHHGYIRAGSIQIFNTSHGKVRMFSLNGDVEYVLDFYADICNPPNGTVLNAYVVNMNRYGALAEVYMETQGADDGIPQRTTIMEIILPRNDVGDGSTEDIDSLNIGMKVTIVILGKKFSLNETKLSVLGRLATEEEKESISTSVNNNRTADTVDPDDDSVVDDGFDIVESEENDSDEEDKSEFDSVISEEDFGDELAVDNGAEDYEADD